MRAYAGRPGGGDATGGRQGGATSATNDPGEWPRSGALRGGGADRSGYLMRIIFRVSERPPTLSRDQ